jgi:Cu+-exporting ATPase
MEKDPVCEMTVHPHAKELKSAYQGKTYHFCSALCQQLFLRDPEKYIAAYTNS